MSLEPLIPGLNSSRRVTCGASDELDVQGCVDPSPGLNKLQKPDPALRGVKSHLLPSHPFLLCPFSQASPLVTQGPV